MLALAQGRRRDVGGQSKGGVVSATVDQLVAAFLAKFNDALDDRDELMPDTLPYAVVHGDVAAARVLWVEVAMEYDVDMTIVEEAFVKFVEVLDFGTAALSDIEEL